MVFPSTRACTRAVQAVEVTPQRSAGSSTAKRSHTFTFCLEHVTQGPFKVNAVVPCHHCLNAPLHGELVSATLKSLSGLTANIASCLSKDATHITSTCI